MADVAELTRMIGPEVEAEGLSLVRVKLTGGTSDPTVQVMAERPDTRQMTIDDCERLSRRISERFESLSDDYRLEVSSPGIDRPLTRLADYDDWKGHEARIELVEKVGGRKSLSGTLRGLAGDEVRLDLPTGEEIRLPLANIHSAKLVLTDRLIAATAPLSSEGADIIQVEGQE